MGTSARQQFVRNHASCIKTANAKLVHRQSSDNEGMVVGAHADIGSAWGVRQGQLYVNAETGTKR